MSTDVQRCTGWGRLVPSAICRLVGVWERTVPAPSSCWQSWYYHPERLAICLGLLLFLLPHAALAHRLDEYLQATLVSIAPGEIRLQINLTPGVEIADQVLALIDRNRDGTISTNEAAAYSELFQRDLVVRLDGHKVGLKLNAMNFAAPSELQTGWGIIQLEFSGRIRPLTPGAHKLAFQNRHLPRLSVYLFNAAQPKSSLLVITKQSRNQTQSTGEIAFTFGREASLKAASAGD